MTYADAKPGDLKKAGNATHAEHSLGQGGIILGAESLEVVAICSAFGHTVIRVLHSQLSQTKSVQHFPAAAHCIKHLSTLMRSILRDFELLNAVIKYYLSKASTRNHICT